MINKLKNLTNYKNNIYKDDSPENTVQRIRNILIKNNIFTTEQNWIINRNCFYSCSVVENNTKFSTNGKGLSDSYALASAYGEFMERLQNQIIYNKIIFSPEDKKIWFSVCT